MSNWRPSLRAVVTGVRTSLGAIDLRRCTDDADEGIARDAFLEGRLAVIDELLGVLALPGTRQIVLVTRHALRVI